MSVRVSRQVWRLALSPPEKLVLLCYADHAHADGNGVYPSYELVAKETGYTRAGVMKITARLEKKGYLVCVKKGGGRRPGSEKGLANSWRVDLGADGKQSTGLTVSGGGKQSTGLTVSGGKQSTADESYSKPGLPQPSSNTLNRHLQRVEQLSSSSSMRDDDDFSNLDGLKNALSDFQEAFGTKDHLSDNEQEQLQERLDALERLGHPEWFEVALRRSREQGPKYPWRYLRKVLDEAIATREAPGSRGNGSKLGESKANAAVRIARETDPHDMTAEERRAYYVPAGYEELIEH